MQWSALWGSIDENELLEGSEYSGDVGAVEEELLLGNSGAES